VCTAYGLAVCMFLSGPFIKARWPSGWVQTYLVVREGTECLCCFCSCVRTPWTASIQTVVLTYPGFGKVNSESLQIHYTCSCLGGHFPVQHPGIDHNCVNQVIENSKLPFIGSHLSENLPVFVLSKLMFWMWLLYTDTTAGHDISAWSFSSYCHICDLGNLPTNVQDRLCCFT